MAKPTSDDAPELPFSAPAMFRKPSHGVAVLQVTISELPLRTSIVLDRIESSYVHSMASAATTPHAQPRKNLLDRRSGLTDKLKSGCVTCRYSLKEALPYFSMFHAKPLTLIQAHPKRKISSCSFKCDEESQTVSDVSRAVTSVGDGQVALAPIYSSVQTPTCHAKSTRARTAFPTRPRRTEACGTMARTPR